MHLILSDLNLLDSLATEILIYKMMIWRSRCKFGWAISVLSVNTFNEIKLPMPNR